jgi:hypothetical protein
MRTRAAIATVLLAVMCAPVRVLLATADGPRGFGAFRCLGANPAAMKEPQ